MRTLVWSGAAFLGLVLLVAFLAPRNQGIAAVISVLALSLGVLTIATIIAKKFRVPILLYHAVTPTVKAGRKINITSASFEKQMRYLKNNYAVMRLDELCTLREQNKLPENAIAITFDNNILSFYKHALPTLIKYQLPATIFVIVGELDRLGKHNLQNMVESGLIAFGSHTISHPDLRKLDGRQLHLELRGSKELLEKQLGMPVESFAYSYGYFNDEVKQKTREAGYSIATAVSPAKIFATDDIFSLRRIPITQHSERSVIFRLQLSGYLDFAQYFGSLIKRTLHRNPTE